MYLHNMQKAEPRHSLHLINPNTISLNNWVNTALMLYGGIVTV